MAGGGTVHIVSSLSDAGPGSLRETIATAHSGDTISFAVRGTIVLTNGELVLTNSLRIIGPGATNLALSANRNSRVIEILQGALVGVSGLTICDGHALDGVAGTSNNPVGGDGGGGGGIYNAGSVTVAQCVISNCAAGNGGAGYLIRTYYGSPNCTNWIAGLGGRGGAIYNAGKLLVSGSTLTSNSSGAGSNGGGAGAYGTAGSGGGGGGAICNMGTMSITNCTFEYNAAGHGGDGYSLIIDEFPGPSDGGEPGGAGGDGGAFYDAGQTTTTIVDSHFTCNSSGAGGIGNTEATLYSLPSVGGFGGAGGGGGAVWAEGSIRVKRCTFVANQTGPGGLGGLGVRIAGRGGIGGPGGAICAVGELSLTDCSCISNDATWGGDGGPTFHSGLAGSGGSGGSGGAVFALSTLRLNYCTFKANRAGWGGQGASVPAPRGYPSGPGGGGRGGYGGALYCDSELAATNCTFSGNCAGSAGGPGSAGFNPDVSGQASTSGSAGGQGGAIFACGMLVLHGCTLSGNVGGNGSSADAGSYFFSNSELGAVPYLIYYDRSGGPGGPGGTGGICSEGSLVLSLCTLSSNAGGAGGSGGYSSGEWPVTGFLTGGAGGSGGPAAVCSLSSNGPILIACTIANNRGGDGGPGGSGDGNFYTGTTGQGSGGAGGVGGVSNTNAAAPASVINTIVASDVGGFGGSGGPWRDSAGPAGAPDLEGAFISLGHNFIGQIDGSSGFANGLNSDRCGSGSAPMDPLLGPLADNGGPTLTRALLHASPALDGGDDALLQRPYVMRRDQRGYPRKSGAHVDIGAFEFQYAVRRDGFARGPLLNGNVSLNSNLPWNPPSKESGADGQATRTFQLTFSNSNPGATFTVLAATNLSVPPDKWTVLGQPTETEAGLFQFTDLEAATNPQRFYRVSSP
jgi:hypothetical protein